jgi:(p)ppGpp synthase/HD superfamily hydrolase
MEIAQTNVQLYNQLRRKGLRLDDLLVVHRAYELLTTLYAGFFQADGKPFVAHGVGVASILAELDQPAEILAVGLLHNVYGNADFGDGRDGVVTAFRRRVVRAAVGDDVEELLLRFRELRIMSRNVEQVRRTLSERSEIERRLICVELADYLEKHVDLGILYWDRSSRVVGASELIGDDLIAIAHGLGEPGLAEMLSRAFSATASQRDQVPVALRPSDGRPYLRLIVPRSCRQRVLVSVRIAVRRLYQRARLRARLRELLSARPRGSRT